MALLLLLWLLLILLMNEYSEGRQYFIWFPFSMEIDLFSSTSSWLVVFGSEKPGLCYFQFNLLVVSNFLQSHGLQHIRLPCPSPTPSACSNSCPLSWWCHPTISSSVISFSFHLQSFPTSGSFLVNHFFTSGGQSIRVSASVSVLPMNIQDWFPLGWTGWISLQFKELSNATV